jgi:hypothetical protein
MAYDLAAELQFAIKLADAEDVITLPHSTRTTSLSTSRPIKPKSPR